MKWKREIVPNLTLCKKLKKAGYPQNKAGIFWFKEAGKWVLREVVDVYTVKRFMRDYQDDMVKAPTTAELLEKLPFSIQKGRKRGFLIMGKVRRWPWHVVYTTGRSAIVAVNDKRLSNALAKMYLALKEGENED